MGATTLARTPGTLVVVRCVACAMGTKLCGTELCVNEGCWIGLRVHALLAAVTPPPRALLHTFTLPCIPA